MFPISGSFEGNPSHSTTSSDPSQPTFATNLSALVSRLVPMIVVYCKFFMYRCVCMWFIILKIASQCF